MKYILLDTNIYVNDFWLKSNLFKVLLQNYSAVAHHIIMPEVIYDEVINQNKKKILETVTQLTKPLKNLNMYMDASFDINSYVESNNTSMKYSEFIDEYIKKYKVKMLEYPTVSHKYIAKKAMCREKPFKERGDGYCDALIWENIIDLISSDDCEILHFVTANHLDFFQNGQLSRDLLKELQDRKVNEDKLKVYVSLKDFNENNILPILQTREKTTDMIKNNSFKDFDFNDWLRGMIFNEIDRDTELLDELSYYYREFDVHMEEVSAIKNIDIIHENFLPDGEIYLELKVTANIGISLCTDIVSYSRSDTIKHTFDSYSESFDDDYKCIYINYPITMNTSIIFETDIRKSEVSVYSISMMDLSSI